MYDPTVGRWLSADPIGFEAGDVNLYRYVGNRPLWRSDPDGLQADDGPPEEYEPFFPPPTNWFDNPEEILQRVLQQWMEDFEAKHFNSVEEIQSQLPQYAFSNETGFDFKFGYLNWDLDAEACRLSDASTGANLDLQSEGKIGIVALVPLTYSESSISGIDYWTVVRAKAAAQLEADMRTRVKAAFAAGSGFETLHNFEFNMNSQWDANATIGAGFNADSSDVNGLSISGAALLNAGASGAGEGLSVFGEHPSVHAEWEGRMTSAFEKEFAPGLGKIRFGAFMEAGSEGKVEAACGVYFKAIK